VNVLPIMTQLVGCLISFVRYGVDARLIAQSLTKWNIIDFIWYFCVFVRSPPRTRSRT